MKKPSSFKHVFAEALILTNFLALLAGVVMIPLLEPSPIGLVALALGLLLSIAIAAAYGLYISQDKPPVGTRMVESVVVAKTRRQLSEKSDLWLI